MTYDFLRDAIRRTTTDLGEQRDQRLEWADGVADLVEALPDLMIVERRRRKQTARQAAIQCGLPDREWSRYERRHYYPSLRNIVKILRWLGLETEKSAA